MSFIVIEGLDGSGKSTQLSLLENYLQKNNVSYKYLHFPRIESPIFGELIAKFLRGDLGNLSNVDPYLVALIYAGDRHNAKNMINEWLKTDLVIVDRYVYSNIAFQCAKLTSESEKAVLKKWILNLEFEFYKIPKPDLSIFLDVPFNFTAKKLTQERKGEDRDYLQGKNDIHESDLLFQQEVKKVYIDALKTDSCFSKIECCENNEMLLPQAIHEKIINLLKTKNIL